MKKRNECDEQFKKNRLYTIKGERSLSFNWLVLVYVKISFSAFRSRDSNALKIDMTFFLSFFFFTLCVLCSLTNQLIYYPIYLSLVGNLTGLIHPGCNRTLFLWKNYKDKYISLIDFNTIQICTSCIYNEINET